MSAKEVASLLKVGEDTVERLIGSGQLSASEISGKGRAAGRKFKRIRREALEDFLRANEAHCLPPSRPRLPKHLRPPKDYFG